jgi:hypothetical protein
VHEPAEESLIGSFCQCFYCKICLQWYNINLLSWKQAQESMNSSYMEFNVIQYSIKKTKQT